MPTLERPRLAVSGCRLADGRLHWGHVNGCFTRLASLTSTRVLFVVQDEHSHPEFTLKFKRQEVINLARELYSVPSNSILVVALQSALIPAYAGVLQLLSATTTISLLEDSNPKKAAIAAKAGLTVADYLFPLHQVAQILGCNSGLVLMNDDNLRFVHLARRLRRRVAQMYPSIEFARPDLLPGPVPRLLGPDGRKMSKANSNAIFISDPPEIVRGKVARYADKKSLFSKGSEVRIALKKGVDLALPETVPISSLVACVRWIKAPGTPPFGSTLHLSEIGNIVEEMASSMSSWNDSVRAEGARMSDEEVLSRLSAHQAEAQSMFARSAETIASVV